eukprot:TRINITY_DN1705_c0_g1_i1.p1 TRINITY_DN1705_c0_g1~~TRINITY_DN1705_c0_g1_i1.p1  ORF type:complete len:140 (-),score=25.63 TRINITY_DN1705_c0_g1_i1:281-700(-)
MSNYQVMHSSREMNAARRVPSSSSQFDQVNDDSGCDAFFGVHCERSVGSVPGECYVGVPDDLNSHVMDYEECRSLCDASEYPMFIKDLSGLYLHVNRGFYFMLEQWKVSGMSGDVRVVTQKVNLENGNMVVLGVLLPVN